MNATKAANYFFDNRTSPRGWKAILVGGENFSEYEVGHEILKDGTIWGVTCGETGVVLVPDLEEQNAFKYAVSQQDFEGNYDAWCGMSDNERQWYELGAEGIGTV